MLLDPDTLPAEPTKQEVYDFVCRHLAAQGYRSVNSGGHCLYFGPDDTCCAAGCLMNRSVARLPVERTGVASLALVTGLRETDTRFYYLVSRDEYLLLLSRLQIVHDSSYHWEAEYIMLTALRNVAIHSDVDPSILDRLDFGLIMPNPVSH